MVVIHRTFLLTVILLLAIPGAANTLTGQQQPVSTAPLRGEATPLAIGTPIGRDISGGEAHTYRITMTSGQYLRVVVDQQGMDVIVALINPKAQKVLEVDSPNGSKGREPLSTIAEADGEHLIEVRSPTKTAKPGRYEIKLEALEVPTEPDRNRVAAEAKFRQARKLSLQPEAPSRREAIAKYEEALPAFLALGDSPMAVLTLNFTGLLYQSFGETQRALDCYSQALPISRAIGDVLREAALLNNLGGVYDSLGEPHKALTHFEQALSLWQSLDLKDQLGNTLNNIGLVYFNLGELQKALEYYQRALPIRRAGSNRRWEADTLDNLGLLYRMLGERERALEHYQQALELRRSAKDIQGEANTLLRIGFGYTETGDNAKLKNT